MRLRTIGLFALAIAAAAGTAHMARGWVEATEQSARAKQDSSAGPEFGMGAMAIAEPEAPLPRVLVATMDLPTGTILRREHLDWRPWPEAALDERYRVEGKVELDSMFGAVARNAITSGEPILESRLVRLGDSGFLAAILKPGMRAVTVPVDASSGIAGLVMPGDRVDVIVTHEYGRDENQVTRRVSETVLNNVRILALDQRLDDVAKEAGLAKTATLEVEPKHTEVIATVTEMGKISLSLRALPGDDEAEQGPKVTSSFTTDSEVSSMLSPIRRAGGPKPEAAGIIIVRANKSELVGASQ
jgi:pilus assembly protein CpaB